MVFNPVQPSVVPASVFYPVGAAGFGGSATTTLSSISGSVTSQVTFSCWFKTSNTSNQYIFCPGNSSAFVVGMNPNPYFLIGANGGGSKYENRTSSGYADNIWHHLIGSFDTNFSIGNRKGFLYIDDINVTNVITDTGSAFSTDYDDSNMKPYSIGSEHGTILFFNGSLAEIWFSEGVYLDISVLENRRKFISASKRPVFLGNNGELPTSSQPPIYLRGSGTGFNVNSGSAGNFTTTGTLTTPTTTPSAP